jgi:prepilin-type processing-associated H-X9-DG protein
MLRMCLLPRRGISLVEVLVVLGVLGVLVGMILPAVQASRRAAARVECQNHLRQIAIASHHRAESSGRLPPYIQLGKQVGSRTKVYTWCLLLTPYIEQEQLWVEADRALENAPAYQSPPHTGLSTVLKVYTCPADGRLNAPIDDGRFNVAYGSFVSILGDRESRNGPILPGIMSAPLGSTGTRPLEVTDGLSQTVMFGESPPPGRLLAGSWYSDDLPPDLISMQFLWRFGCYMAVRGYGSSSCRGPFQFGPGRLDNMCDSHHLWSLHPGGANFAFADGRVRFLSYSAADILPALATRAGGEVVPGEW